MSPRIRSISAVTLATRDMRRSVRFYRSLGFEIAHGGEEASFTSFSVGPNSLNVAASSDLQPGGRWGRIIFHVSDVDAMHERARSLGYEPSTEPRDAPWGERYFHLSDPDGHELSFARPLG